MSTLNEDLYKAVISFSNSQEALNLSGYKKKYLDDTLLEYKRSGFGLPKEKRDKVKDIFNELEIEAKKKEVDAASYADQDYTLKRIKSIDSLSALKNKFLEAQHFKSQELEKIISSQTTSSGAVREAKSYYMNSKANTIENALSEVEVWKVFSIKDAFDFSQLRAYEPHVDKFLFDTKGKEKGGNGYTFDWEVLKDYNSQKPFILSGGIGLEEVEKVKTILKTDLPIHALDVNSKFEDKPGLKNIEKLEEFIAQLR